MSLVLSRNDIPTLGEISQRYGGWIRARIRPRFPHEAEDLEQEVMLRIGQALPRMQKTGEQSLRGLISRVLRSVLVDEVRRKRRQPTPTDVAEGVADPGTVRDEAEFQESVALVESRFGYLTNEQRRILQLRFRHGMGFRQIAEVLGVPQGTVAGWYSRALHVLRESL
ncbi:MAG: hypothetical protein CMJ83_00940 [Planctomycetes bacterium]|nr:hypothetical protein [Planctomycetota bacterium]